MTPAEDIGKELDLKGTVAVVTGGDSDLGFPVVKTLAERHAKVVIASRNLTKCQALADKAKNETGGDVIAMALDLGNFSSVRAFAKEYFETVGPKLDWLIHNAGIAGNPQHASVDGFQLLFQVNFLSPFLLTELLLPALRYGGGFTAGARVVAVSSSEHRIGCEAAGWSEGCMGNFSYFPPPAVVPDKNVTIHYSDGGTEVRPLELYGFTKAILIQYISELHRREAAFGRFVHGYSLTPGWVNTSLTRRVPLNSTVAQRKCREQLGYPCPFTPSEGATISVFAALEAPISESGSYVSRIKKCQVDTPTSHGFKPAMGAELYTRALKLVGLSQPGSDRHEVVV